MNKLPSFSFDVTPVIEKAQAMATIPDFKGFLKGIAFHTLPKMNANHCGFTLATVENSLHTLKGTPLNVHHTQWDITGFIEDCRIGDLRADNSQPIHIDSVVWKGVEAQTEFLDDVIKSVNLKENRYKFSMEVQYTEWVFVAYDKSGSNPPIIIDSPEVQNRRPEELVGQLIVQGPNAGRTIGVLLGGLDGQLMFNGVAVTIEDITPAADQEAVITAAGTKGSVESIEGEVTPVKNTTETTQEKSMDFTNMTITELLAVEGEEKEAAVAYLSENFSRTPEVSEEVATEEVAEEVATEEESTEAVETEVAEESYDIKGAIEQILSLLTPAEVVATEEATEETEEVVETVDPRDETITELQEEIIENRLASLASLMGDEFLASEEKKTSVVANLQGMNKAAFTAYCDELKAVAEVAIAKAKAEAEKLSTVTAPEKSEATVNGVEISKNTFSFSQEAE